MTETYKAKAYYPNAQSWEKIEEPEQSFNAVCADFSGRGFKVIECSDTWEGVKPWSDNT